MNRPRCFICCLQHIHRKKRKTTAPIKIIKAKIAKAIHGITASTMSVE